MTIRTRSFGSTGHQSSEVIFGGAALWSESQATADRILDLLLEHGVNHIDTAPRYGDSELRIGPWMAHHRQDFFLATKIAERDQAGARDSIHRSLDRLRTDHIDLLQLHALIHPDEWEQALAPGGALDAAIEAREQGLVRFIGVTGHGWNVAAMHRRALERFAFDSVLMPWNWFAANHPTYARDFEETVALCAARGVAVQTIKSCARGAWAAGAAHTHTTWYQPLDAKPDIETAVAWVLGRPGIFLISTGDVAILPTILEAAVRRPTMPDAAAMEALEARSGLSSIFGL